MRLPIVLVLLAAACGTPAPERGFASGEPSGAPASQREAPQVAASLAPCRGYPAQGLASTTPTPPQVVGTKQITLFYGTHTHGFLVRPDRITFAHVAGLVGELRASLPRPARSLFVGNGDDLDSELCGVATASRHVIDAFNAAGLDADTFGYNEVSPEISRIEPPALLDLIGASRFTWVSANVLDSSGADVFGKERGARRFVIRDLDGIRVGITGLVSLRPRAGFSVAAFEREMRALDPVIAMRAVVPEMRRAGAQVVVVLSHMGIEDVERVAREAEGIDVIVGNHCCDMGYLRQFGSTLVTDGHDNMNQVGELDLFLRDGHVVAHAFSLHAVTAAAPVDRAVTAVLERYVGKR